MTSDPRAAGFNYSTGWGSHPKPPIYLEALRLSRRLNATALDASQRAWTLEMALRDVRLATTGVEKAVAVQALQRYFEYEEPQPFVLMAAEG